MTVEQALSIFPLQHGKLVAGEAGLTRVIRSVNVMDAPDIVNWLKYGEILLTSAFVFKGYPEAAIDLIRRLHAGGCSALGIKLGRYWEVIPGHLIEEANELGFPLIELPYEYTFSDMMKGLYTTSLGEEVKGLNLVLTKQKSLIQLALSQSAEQDVYNTLSDILEYPVAVISRSGHLLFNTSGWEESFWRPRLATAQGTRWCGSQETRYFQIPLQQGDALYGYLMVVPGKSQVMKDEDGVFVLAGDLLSRYMGRKKRQGEGEREEWVTDLLMYLQSRAPLAVLLSSLDKYGIALPLDQYRCVLATVNDQEVDAFWDVHEKLEFAPELAAYKGIHIPIGKTILSLYSLASLPESENRALGECLAALFGGPGSERLQPRFYMSRIKNQASQLKDAYAECVNTQQTVQQTEMPGAVFYDEDLEVYRLLQYIPDDVLASYSSKFLGPLQHSEEMIRTLELFLEYDGQINEVAKRMFVHRNTIAYRMEKINSLLHIEFRNFNDILKLKLVFWHYKKHKEEA
ncbi:PucR family transcriptional regulator [Paenibacillus sp. 2TAB19]|uniref:PucR family transcriptional regulator n=1 Tax=Paenibacillus sp. 2TAB19 TaxID=3233003 RepID=UPI003F9659B5